MPLVYGGSIALSALIGWFIFKEPVSVLHMIGVIAIILGIGLVIFSKI